MRGGAPASFARHEARRLMPPNKAITDHARTLALRLRLGLVDLQTIEQWADESILQDSAPPEIADLCLATRAGERITLRILTEMGGPPAGLDIMQAVSAVRVEDASQDELRRLADNLDPVLREVDAGSGLPPLLKSGLTLARDFWEARMQSSEEMTHVEERMRDLLHAVKDYAAELPTEKPAVAEPEVHKVSAIVVSFNTGACLFDCLAALEADPGVAEVVLVNNGNPVETLERVEDAYGKSPKVKVIGGGQNRGFAAGVNLGAASATGDRLLVINPDAVLQPASDPCFRARHGGCRRACHRRRQDIRRRWRRTTWRPPSPPHHAFSRRDLPRPVLAARHQPRFHEHQPPHRTGTRGPRADGRCQRRADVHVSVQLPPSRRVRRRLLPSCRGSRSLPSRRGGWRLGDLHPHASALHFGATSDAPSLFVEKRKGAGFNRYFRKYAETPGEKLVAGVLGPTIAILLAMRARVKSLRASKP